MENNQANPEPIQPSTYPPPQPKHNLYLIIGALIILAIGATGGIVAGKYFFEPKTSAKIEVPTPIPTPSIAIPTPTTVKTDETANWKIFTFEKITFKYPSDWQDPKYIKTGFGQSAEIKNQNETQRLIVLSGINKGSTEQDLSKFINDSVAGGAEKLTLDGSEAAKSKDNPPYQGTKIITVYVTSKDKTFHYGISLNYPESYPDQEMDKLLNQILSTFRFD